MKTANQSETRAVDNVIVFNHKSFIVIFNWHTLAFSILKCWTIENRSLCGLWIERSDKHRDTFDSIQVNRECDSNEIGECTIQSTKHDDSTISTFGGISIEPSDDSRNAFDSNRIESIANLIQVTRKNDSQNEKHDNRTLATFREMSIHWNNECKNTFDAIRFHSI
jgi:hypothetical protein